MSDAAPTWPGAPAFVVLRVRGGRVERVGESGDLAEPRPWASVSKLAVGLAVAVEVDLGRRTYEEVLGPDGATLAHLLAHASGLGLEEGDRVQPVGSRRVYSNAGVDRAARAVAGDGREATWLAERVFAPLGISGALEGRAAAGVVGSTNDLAALAAAWLAPGLVTAATRDRAIAPYLAELAGVVPGFGRFDPCPWGLGPEVAGHKHHWMGAWPPASFGHFGQSGALLLANADEGVAVVATSTVAFGPWALGLWPTWTSAMRERALG